MKALARFLVLGLIFLLSVSFIPTNGKKPSCSYTGQGRAIDWSPGFKLKWSDFKAKEKTIPGFAVAYSTCGFGYDGIINGNQIKVNIYVRFYCEESWRDPNYSMSDVLQHEQLHFDISELYGRKFYNGITSLRQQNKLNENTLAELYDKLQKEYDVAQDRYDAETNHSTNGSKQGYWNTMVNRELNRYADFANYHEF